MTEQRLLNVLNVLAINDLIADEEEHILGFGRPRSRKAFEEYYGADSDGNVKLIRKLVPKFFIDR